MATQKPREKVYTGSPEDIQKQWYNDQMTERASLSKPPTTTTPAPKTSTGLTAEQQKLKAGITAGNAGAVVNIQAGNDVEGLSAGNVVTIDGQEYNLNGGSNRNSTPTRMINIPKTVSKDNSAVLATAGKTGVTNTLPQGKTDSLPGVTKYAGQDQTAGGIKYGNNQAGIDLLNSSNKTPMEGVYNPIPTVATTQNPVIKKTLPKEETPVKPDIKAMDLPTIQENIDRLTYKVNSGKSLTEDEYVTFNQLRRQAIEMMKPQSLTGGLDNLMQQQQNEIATTQQTQEEQNAKDLEAFTKSQEAYKASQIAMIEKEENLSRQRMAAIFGATGQDSSTDTMSNFSEMEQNYALRKEAKLAEIQAKIDLFGSQQRKDSAETIQKMKDNLYNTQLKAAEYDVKDIEAVNAFNKEQSKSVLDSLDKLKAASDGIIASSTPLTEDQKKQAEVIANLIIDDKGNLDKTLLDSYGKTHPNLIPFATSLAVDLKKKAQENNLLMQGLDADIKKAQLNKLLNPAKEYEYVKDPDGNTIAVAKDNPNERINITGGNADATVIDTIKKWEGFRDKAYQDSTGTWTIGYGFTNVNGQPVKPGMTMDRGTADNLLGQEISQRQNFMNYINVPLSESQKAALSSFEFNLGSGIREKNAKPILDKINAGDLQGAGNLMKQYTTSKGQQLQGLVNRRNEEARLLLDKGQKTAEYKTDKDATKEITALRKEFNALPEVKNYKQVVTSYKTIEEQAKKATPAGDLSMIFAYMKLLDPTSTVREGEFANAQNAASIPDQVRNAYNKAAQGTRLNDKQRQDFLNGAKVQLKSYEDLHNQALENYRTYITMGGNPSDIGEFGDVSGLSVKEATEKALQAGGQTQNISSSQVEDDFTTYFQ